MRRTTKTSVDAINAIVAEYGIEKFCKWQRRPAGLRVVFGDSVWLIRSSMRLNAAEFNFELGRLDTLARCITARWPEPPQPSRAERRRQKAKNVAEYMGAMA